MGFWDRAVSRRRRRCAVWRGGPRRPVGAAGLWWRRTRRRSIFLAALAVDGAVQIIQLVDARDGSARPGIDVASAAEIAAATALGPTLEGNTTHQRNPHPVGRLSWLSWIVARLGGWNCYYKPPGPKTMRRGRDKLAAISIGYALTDGGRENMRIP